MSIVNEPLMFQINRLDLREMSPEFRTQVMGTAALVDQEIVRLDTRKCLVRVSYFAGDRDEVIFELLMKDRHSYFLVLGDGSHRWGVTDAGRVVETGKDFSTALEINRILRLSLPRLP